MLTTSKYIAFTLPKPVATHVRDIIYFRDITLCTVKYSQKLPRSYASAASDLRLA